MFRFSSISRQSEIQTFMWNLLILKTMNRPNETCESNFICGPPLCNVPVRWSLKTLSPLLFTSCPILCALALRWLPWRSPLPPPLPPLKGPVSSGPEQAQGAGSCNNCQQFPELEYAFCSVWSSSRSALGRTAGEESRELQELFRTLCNSSC